MKSLKEACEIVIQDPSLGHGAGICLCEELKVSGISDNCIDVLHESFTRSMDYIVQSGNPVAFKAVCMLYLETGIRIGLQMNELPLEELIKK